MWKAEVGGRALHFELAGINNQNFLLRDAETGSWWQQVTGEAIQGPLEGERLELVPWDEVSFEIWQREHPESLVLSPKEEFAGRYYPADWPERVRKLPTVVEIDPAAGLEPRDLIVGVELDGVAKAYPFAVLAEQSPVMDVVGSTPLAIVVADDGESVRSFDRTVEGEALDFYRKADSHELRLIDAQTGSEWDFSGRAVAGPLVGEELARVQALKDYWFDWQHYHPETRLYKAGLRSSSKN